MKTRLLRVLVYLASAAAGLVLADLFVGGFRISWLDWWGFLVAIVVFAIVQSLATPLASRLAQKHAPLLLGGIGIIATFVSLLVVAVLPSAGVRITTAAAWFLAPLVVWIVSAVVTWVLTVLLIDRRARTLPSTKR
ncbi:MAG: phage holin family protein [Microbacterium sp.]|jgi:uncharacterized membrane protein YvlD (DUF360 family)|uniref:phage holin family protein n=1 Tax=Microbacterium sp. TaxID=51671 RepID=UPI0025E51402|nr:phage holin family protein [Microbacterium sp.]MBQ9917054.1 phage holin family protein [Microbacterium sp.]